MFLSGKGGVHVPHNKNTAGQCAVRMPAPETVVIPVSMHIGRPAAPVVKPKDHVKVGTLIAESQGPVSARIVASVSGDVEKIDRVLLSNGAYSDAIIIKSDGLNEKDESLTPPTVTDYESFIAAVRESGIVGLGGAGFPTAVKLDVKDTSRIKHVIINAAECEPYITSDTRTMLDDSEDIFAGVVLLEKYLSAKSIIIGIEKNKPEAIEKMRETFKNDAFVTIMPLPELYPQGAEKVIIRNTTGLTVKKGKLPIDAGCVVINVTTLAQIAKYVRTGVPLTEKCVTIDGTAVKTPKNIIVPIGTRVSDIISFCNIDENDVYKILFGGPMMGISVPNASVPVLKNTNAVTFMGKAEAASPRATQCIHCGRCATHCPMNLTTFAIARAYEKQDVDALIALNTDLCCECGSCSFICPAKRPLVEINKLAKAMIREHNQKQQAAKGEKTK